MTMPGSAILFRAQHRESEIVYVTRGILTWDIWEGDSELLEIDRPYGGYIPR